MYNLSGSPWIVKTLVESGVVAQVPTIVNAVAVLDAIGRYCPAPVPAMIRTT